jgi:hypothetical protein
MPSTDDLLIKLILYGVLPLWGITGFFDWCCHRATRIEHTSGIKESAMHSLMGIQLGVPIVLCLTFHVNVLLLILCVDELARHRSRARRDAQALYASHRLRDFACALHVLVLLVTHGRGIP